MTLYRLLMGRRNFLLSFFGAAVGLFFGTAGRALNFFFRYNTAHAAEAQKSGGEKRLKGCVVYYSATGSTRKAAQAIHRGMAAVIDCDIFPVKKIDPKEMGKYDLVAIGGPIWYNRETINLDLFIYGMPRMDGKLCVPFCTHGVGPNGFMYNISKALRKMGMTVIGWRDWYGSVFHVLHQPKPYHTDGHPDKVDLKDAEVFGREMAERAQRIYAGERKLIPEIPEGSDVDTLWIPKLMEREENVVGVSAAAMAGMGAMPPQGGMPGVGQAGGPEGGGPGAPGGLFGGDGSMGMGYYPTIDVDKCVYPRCTSCMDICYQNAIDLSRLTAPSGTLTGMDVVVKNACVQCKYPVCQRACSHDAVIYKSATTHHVIDMKKCTYPKCTLCIDECLMNSIYFEDGQLKFHSNCEGCDVCFCVCPTGAVTIDNIADTVHFGAGDSESGRGGMPSPGGQQGGPPGGMPSPEGQGEGMPSGGGMMEIQQLNPGEDPETTMARTLSSDRYRRLVPLNEVGKYYAAVQKVEHRPILVLQDDDWPLMKDKDGNIIGNYWD